MFRKRIQKRLDQLFTEIKKDNEEIDTLLSASQVSEQQYVQHSEQSGEESKETVADSNQPATEERPVQNIFQRCISWFTRSRFIAEEQDVEGLDYQGVDQRLIGEKPPESLPGQAFRRTKRRFGKRQQAQPEQQIPTGPVTSLPTVEIRGSEEPKFEELRPAALEEYEPPTSEGLPVLERLRDWFRYLNVEQKVLLFSSIFVFVAISFFLVLALFLPKQPAVIPLVSKLDPSIPTPVAVILPDNQTFVLSVGAVVDGNWMPQGSEWLIDTEVPRWLSLPWNEELEATAYLYKKNDPLQLQMSNGDILVYRFQNAEEILVSELSLFHANTADLLIMLYKPRSSTCLVLIAGP